MPNSLSERQKRFEEKFQLAGPGNTVCATPKDFLSFLESEVKRVEGAWERCAEMTLAYLKDNSVDMKKSAIRTLEEGIDRLSQGNREE